MVNGPRFNCGIDATMSIIEGRWKCTILCLLAVNGEMRFTDIRNKIEVVSNRILSRQLKELEADGMIRKKVQSDSSNRSIYMLTAKGESIIPLLAPLAKWGVDNVFSNRVIIDVPDDASSEKSIS